MMAFYDSICKYCPDTGRITGAYMIFYHGAPIDHSAHVLEPVTQSSTESECNAACTARIYLAHLRMLIHELFNNNRDIVL